MTIPNKNCLIRFGSIMSIGKTNISGKLTFFKAEVLYKQSALVQIIRVKFTLIWNYPIQISVYMG
jgi:hypothetical protein